MVAAVLAMCDIATKRNNDNTASATVPAQTRGLLIVLRVKLITYSIAEMKRREIILILDNIRSRENVGSIFRTADAAGVMKIYLCGITPRPPHEKISKTALGADTYIPWEYYKNTWRLLEELKKKEVRIIALEKTKGAKNIFEIKGKTPLALVMGNEVNGLSIEILKRADVVAVIPMRGKKESLNVAVSAGIAVYAILNS